MADSKKTEAAEAKAPKPTFDPTLTVQPAQVEQAKPAADGDQVAPDAFAEIEGPEKIVPPAQINPEVRARIGDQRLPASVYAETLPGETQKEGAVRRNRDHEIASARIRRAKHKK